MADFCSYILAFLCSWVSTWSLAQSLNLFVRHSIRYERRRCQRDGGEWLITHVENGQCSQGHHPSGSCYGEQPLGRFGELTYTIIKGQWPLISGVAGTQYWAPTSPSLEAGWRKRAPANSHECSHNLRSSLKDGGRWIISWFSTGATGCSLLVVLKIFEKSKMCSCPRKLNVPKSNYSFQWKVNVQFAQVCLSYLQLSHDVLKFILRVRSGINHEPESTGFCYWICATNAAIIVAQNLPSNLGKTAVTVTTSCRES